MKFPTLIALSVLTLSTAAVIERRSPLPDEHLAELAPRALTASQVIANINKITTLSTDLTTIARSITPGNLPIPLPLPLRTFSPTAFAPLITGFKNIVATATAAYASMGSPPLTPYAVADQTAICNAFRNFVAVHKALLDVVIGKSGLLQSVGLAPVAAVLAQLEKIVDTLALSIIGLVPTCAASAKLDLASLDDKIEAAQCAYIPLGPLLPKFCPKKAILPTLPIPKLPGLPTLPLPIV